jgi:hypothetical protein
MGARGREMTCKVSGLKGWETGGVGDDGIKKDARQALGWGD